MATSTNAPLNKATLIPRVISLIFATISFVAWILYVIGWGITYPKLGLSENAFIPFWIFVASGPLIFVTSVLRDAVELCRCTTNATVRALGWILVAFHIFFFIVFLLSGIVMLIEVALVLWVASIFILAAGSVVIGIVALICCGGIVSLLFQCLGSVVAIISGAISLASNTTPNQNAVLQPMNVLPPMQQQMVMYPTPNQPPAYNEMNMSFNPYGQPMYGQPMYGQPMYGQPMYGQPMPSQQPMGTYDGSIPKEKQSEHVPGQNPTSSKDFSQEVSIHVEN